MNKFILPLLLISNCYFSQTQANKNPGNAVTFYNLAVEEYNREAYKKSDSLFTLSLKLKKTADGYFGRALCRDKLAEQKNYCSDLTAASIFGKREAAVLFKNQCGTIDTTYPKLKQEFTETDIFSRRIRYRYADTLRIYTQKYYSQHISEQKQGDTSVTDDPRKIETQAEFPGGVGELMNFIKRETKRPDPLPEAGVRGKVFLKFIVLENGKIDRIEVLKGISECPGCDEEATRLIAIMPLWKPATMNGKPVKCYFNLPISFNIQ